LLRSNLDHVDADRQSSGGLEVLDPRYQELYHRVLLVLGADPRVRKVEPSGSVARGAADQWSDLDLKIITTPEGFDSFLSDWEVWAGRITPTVFARRPIAPFIINTLTDEGLTIDMAVYSGEAPPEYAGPPRYAVGLLASETFEDLGDALEYAVEEQLRGLAGPFITLIQRKEHLRHFTGVPHILGLLTTVFLAETESAPPAKQWNPCFSNEQRQAVADLPPVSATRDGVLSFGLAVAKLVVTRARPLYIRYERPWPGKLARVAADRLEAELGLSVRRWLY
jgi:predicted nucleotidyltransferase